MVLFPETLRLNEGTVFPKRQNVWDIRQETQERKNEKKSLDVDKRGETNKQSENLDFAGQRKWKSRDNYNVEMNDTILGNF